MMAWIALRYGGRVTSSIRTGTSRPEVAPWAARNEVHSGSTHLRMERLGREHQRHRSAVEHSPAEAEDPVVAGLQVALVQEDLEIELFELVPQATDPGPIGRAVRQEDVVAADRFAGAGHGPPPRMLGAHPVTDRRSDALRGRTPYV